MGPKYLPQLQSSWFAEREEVKSILPKSQQPRGQADTVRDVSRTSVTLSSPEEGHRDQRTPRKSIPSPSASCSFPCPAPQRRLRSTLASP